MFILKVKTKKNNYLYDVNSNNFLKVDSEIWENIENYPNIDNNIKEKVDELKKKNIFLKPKVKRFMKPAKEELNNAINNEMNQLILNITEKCNFRCLYCVFSDSYPEIRGHSNKVMSIKTAIKAVDYFFEHNKNAEYCNISFYGGEPLLEFEKIKYIVKYIINNKKREPLFSMTINGSLLNNEIMEFLKEHKFAVSISLDGPKNIHDRYRKDINGEDTFNKIYENLSNFYKKYPGYCKKNIKFITTLCPPYDYIKLVDFFNNSFMKKFNGLKFNHISYPADIFCKNNNVSFKDGFETYKDIYKIYKRNDSSKSKKEILRNIFDSDKDFLRIHNRKMYLLGEEIPINSICILGTARLFCSVDGMFYACERIDEKLPIGDVNKGVSIDKIIEYINKYIEISEESCIKCEYQRFCQICFPSAIKNGELSKNAKDEICISVKKEIKNNIIEYLEIMENNPDFFNQIRERYEKNNCYY